MVKNLNGSEAYQLAKELTISALENHFFEIDKDPGKSAKKIVTFFNEIFWSVQNNPNT